MYNQQQPPSVPIDQEIARIKLAIEGCRLELKQINTVMANERAQYQQKLGTSLLFKPSRYKHDKKLKAQQPRKEQVQARKLHLEQLLHQLKTLKVQGHMFVISAQI